MQKQSPEQQEVDELTDAQGDLQLLTNDQIKQLAAESETPKALLFNLSRLIPGATQSQICSESGSGFMRRRCIGVCNSS